MQNQTKVRKEIPTKSKELKEIKDINKSSVSNSSDNDNYSPTFEPKLPKFAEIKNINVDNNAGYNTSQISTNKIPENTNVNIPTNNTTNNIPTIYVKKKIQNNSGNNSFQSDKEPKANLKINNSEKRLIPTFNININQEGKVGLSPKMQRTNNSLDNNSDKNYKSNTIKSIFQKLKSSKTGQNVQYNDSNDKDSNNDNDYQSEHLINNVNFDLKEEDIENYLN